MIHIVLTTYLRDAYRFGVPFYRCNDKQEGSSVNIAYTGSRAQLDAALLAASITLYTYDLQPRKGDYDVTTAMPACPNEGNCYYLVDDTQLAAAIAANCNAGASTAYITLSSAAAESVSQALNHFSVAHVSGFLCAFLIVLGFLVLTLWPTLAIHEPIMLPKNEGE